MIPNDNAIMLYKFNESRWINKILNGELSFSCAGAYIHQAKQTHNYIQGDEFEGVFARLQNNNPKIQEMKNKLGKDLEILPDNNYCFLRRKSAKLKPIFCFFSYTAEDALHDKQPGKIGKQRVRLNFDQRMFNGFAPSSIRNVISNSHMFTLVYLSPRSFIERIKCFLLSNPYKMDQIEYISLNNEEFFIEPTDEYNELFYKSKTYCYQHEARICLLGIKFSNIFDRYPLHIGKLNAKDYKKCHIPVYIELETDFREVSNIQKVVENNCVKTKPKSNS